MDGYGESRGNTGGAIRFLTIPEALLLLAHDPRTGKRRVHGAEVMNRALLAAGLLELILQHRIIPFQEEWFSQQAATNVLLYRLAPDYDPLPTTYTTELWDRLIPIIDLDQYSPFRRLIGLVLATPRGGSDFAVPDQTRLILCDLKGREVIDFSERAFAPGKIPKTAESIKITRDLERTLQNDLPLRYDMPSTDLRTKFLLGTVYACGLVPVVFKNDTTSAEQSIRAVCRFGNQPETPIGNAYAFIRSLDYAE